MPGETQQSGIPEPVAGRPLFDRFLRKAGFARLVEFGPETLSPLVLFATIVVVIELVVLQCYNLLTGRPIGFIENPVRLIELVVVLGCAIAVELLHKRYNQAIDRSSIFKRAETQDKRLFRQLVPDWLSLFIIVPGVVFMLLNTFLIVTIPHLYEIGGPARIIRFAVLMPFGYVPVLATGLATYVSAEILVPRRLRRSNVGIDYFDPENLGGMRPIGELVKFAYYLIMLELIAYAVALYAPHILEGSLAYDEVSSPGLVANLMFTIVWAGTVGGMLYGIYVLHRYMVQEKMQDLAQLDEEFDKRYADWEQINVADPPEGYEKYRRESQLIASTREYPAKFTMWSQLLVGVVLPKAIQVFLSSI